MSTRRNGNVNPTSTIVFSSLIGVCVVAVLLVAVPPLGLLAALGWAGATVVRVHTRKTNERMNANLHRQTWGY